MAIDWLTLLPPLLGHPVVRGVGALALGAGAGLVVWAQLRMLDLDRRLQVGARAPWEKGLASLAGWMGAALAAAWLLPGAQAPARELFELLGRVGFLLVGAAFGTRVAAVRVAAAEGSEARKALEATAAEWSAVGALVGLAVTGATIPGIGLAIAAIAFLWARQDPDGFQRLVESARRQLPSTSASTGDEVGVPAGHDDQT